MGKHSADTVYGITDKTTESKGKFLRKRAHRPDPPKHNNNDNNLRKTTNTDSPDGTSQRP